MAQNSKAKGSRRSERGATLYIMAASMFVLLGMSALAIDVVSFYVARAQAQRAADAGALAGASQFIAVGCTSTGGCTAGGSQETPATTQAVAVAGENSVAGQAPSSSTVDVAFAYPTAEEPQIHVTVHRDAAHSNALPTFFGQIFGINTVDVSADAWAEAYNPSGGGTSVGVSCIRPFLVPNCDPDHLVSSSAGYEANPNCPADPNLPNYQAGYYMQKYFDSSTGAIVNPGDCNWSTTTSACTGTGIVGEYWQLHDNSGPSQWSTIAFTTQSGANYKQNIYTCAPQVIACHSTLNTLNGNKVGPTTQGVEDLIHANGYGASQGQDEICTSTFPYCTGAPPYIITGGSNNPYGLSGKTFYSPSDSIANVVVYDYTSTYEVLPPGGTTVSVVGFMQLFVQDINKNGGNDLIDAIVMELGGCGTNKSENPTPVTGAGGSFVPLRLIHQ